MATLESEVAEAAIALTQAEAQAEASRADDLLQQMAELKTAAAEALGHLRSRQSLLDDQRSSGQFTHNQIQAKSSHQADLDNSLAELTRQIATLTEKEAQLNLQIEELGAKIDPGERELTQLEQQRTGAEQREQALQQILRRDEATFNSGLAQIAALRGWPGHLAPGDRARLWPGGPGTERRPGGSAAPAPGLYGGASARGGVNCPRAWRRRCGRCGPGCNAWATSTRKPSTSTRKPPPATNSCSPSPRIWKPRPRTCARSSPSWTSACPSPSTSTFRAVDKEFVEFFKILFNGGTAKLSLTDPDDLTNTGIEIVARPPGKRPQSLALLSGGERSMTALALIFAILRVSPTPFCILDEVDAALDEANVDRFRDALRSLSGETQFILITHNRRTLETADTIYGITMGGDGVSKVISLRLDGDKIVRNDGGSDQDAEKLVEGSGGGVGGKHRANRRKKCPAPGDAVVMRVQIHTSAFCKKKPMHRQPCAWASFYNS